ncbi:hypothetical protein EDC96DRAFT_491236 [Choanephora cucurbitarum]|nr:hypothetical protein EDC96DRAFT_491236 [Choanephora cucurbitarum]
MLTQSFIRSLLTIITLFFTSTKAVNVSGTCNSYPSNATCSSFVNYSIFLPIDVNVYQVEAQFKSLEKLGPLLAKVSPVCYDTFMRYQCSKAYARCEANLSSATISVYSACLSSCEEVHQICGDIFDMAGYSDYLPNCSTEKTTMGYTLQPDDACNKIPTKLTSDQIQAGKLNLSAVPAGFVMKSCPSPFVLDPLAKAGTTDSADSKHCLMGCCIPCPAQSYFYKEHEAERGFLATDILRFISAVLSFILVVSYLILPDKRRHPSLLILNMSFAIFLLNMVVFFSVGNPKRLQCAANGISSGAMGNNNLCAAQGAILLFGALSTMLWCAALIVNLHIHTVWNSNFFTHRYYLLYAICWGIPAVVVAVALGLHSIKYEFANLCLVSIEYIFPILFYPLAAVICPAFIIHVATFIYIARTAVREGLQSEITQSLSNNTNLDRLPTVNHKHVLVAVKIQWRALLLTVAALITVLFYWLFYMTQISRVTELQDNPRLLIGWVECMLTPGNTQNFCADMISPHLPPFPMMVAAEALVSFIGIWLFIMFAKRSLWREWNDWIYDKRMSFTRSGRSEKAGEQFFAL